jgi:hypothetical protein
MRNHLQAPSSGSRYAPVVVIATIYFGILLGLYLAERAK